MRHLSSAKTSNAFRQSVHLNIVAIVAHLCAEIVPGKETSQEQHQCHGSTRIHQFAWYWVGSKSFLYSLLHFLARLVSSLWHLLCSTVYNSLYSIGYVWVIFCHTRHCILHHSALNLLHSKQCGVIWSTPRKHIMNEHTNRIDVRAGIDIFAVYLLRTHIGWCAHNVSAV